MTFFDLHGYFLSSLLSCYTALYAAVHRTRKFSAVACSCVGETMQKLVTEVDLVYLDVESPQSTIRLKCYLLKIFYMCYIFLWSFA